MAELRSAIFWVLCPKQSLHCYTWVTLLEPPIYSCYDEALLMCQYPDGHWAAWIPDFGGIKLYSGQFCRMN
jgi:hypothetical protein